MINTKLLSFNNLAIIAFVSIAAIYGFKHFNNKLVGEK